MMASRGGSTFTLLRRCIASHLTDLSHNILTTPSCVILLLLVAHGYFRKISTRDDDDSDNETSIWIKDENHLVIITAAWCTLTMALMGSVHYTLLRRRRLSQLWDVDGIPLDYRQSPLLPFLPADDDNDNDNDGLVSEEARRDIRSQLKSIQSANDDDDKTNASSSNVNVGGWALVTGASNGIGRAIAIELARWKVPVILVARDRSKLETLAEDIRECYGVPTQIIISDFSKPGAAEEVFRQTSSTGILVDILVHNAGIGETANFVDTDVHAIDQIIQVNLMTGTKLCRLYGKEMKQRKRGRILIISSITGIFPGVPTTSVYAATKAFQRSLATSIGKELEPFGVAVTCVMPGAVKQTRFARRANMVNSFVWKFPVGNLTPSVVASCSVRAALAGHAEVVVGWLNVLTVRIATLFLPDRLMTVVSETAWRPFPIHFLSRSSTFHSDETKKKD